MNLNSIVEKRMKESEQQFQLPTKEEAQREALRLSLQSLSETGYSILDDLYDMKIQNQQTQKALSECRTLLSRFDSGFAKQQKQLARLESSLGEARKNISLSTSSSQKANENQNHTMQAILRAVKNVTVGWSFKLLVLLNTILNAGIILLILYLMQNL